MKFLLLTKYVDIDGVAPATEWEPTEITAHMDHMNAVNNDLADSGELLEVIILSGPVLATRVTSTGAGAPVCTDGPFPESKELLAGIQMIDVASRERAVEIAAKVSAAPGPGGRSIAQPIEVRELMARSGPTDL
ncbi:MAG: YciI family protein [Actinomycetota bacterium]